MSLRWGIVGYGWVARDHMHPGLLEAGHTLVGIADPRQEVRTGAAAAGLAASADLAGLLEQGPEAIYVANPNRHHRHAVVAALAGGVPVLCEKPMAADLEDAEQIAAAAEGKLYGTAFNQRHHPAHRAIAAAVADGAIGTVTAVRLHYACWVGPGWQAPGEVGAANWRADPLAAGGGAVIDLALHGLDLGQFLLGEPLERLHITLQRRVHDYPVDDGGLLSGRFARGALFSSHVAYNCPEELPRRRLEVLGTTGMILAHDTLGQDAGGEVSLFPVGGRPTPLPFDSGRSPFAAQADAFAAAVAGRPHEFSAKRDLQLMRLFTAAHREALSCL